MITLETLKRRIDEEKWYAPFHAGDDSPRTRAATAHRALDEFIARCGGREGAVVVHRVPGRVEVLGNHTDYAGGAVLNFASDRGFVIISAESPSPHIRMADSREETAALEINLDTLNSRAISPGDKDWFIYPRRIVKRLVSNFGRESFRGVDAAFASDLPRASGMSSSSALMIAAFLACTAHCRLDDDEVFQEMRGRPSALAAYLGCCENGGDFAIGGRALKGDAGVGTFGGSQDHTAIMTAKKSMLSLNAYCPARHVEDVPVPGGLSFVVAFSGCPSNKTGEARAAFNLISRRIAEIPRLYNNAMGTRYKNAGEMLQLEEGEVTEVIGRNKTDETPALRDRWAHFYEQNNVLIPRAVAALRSGEEARLGGAINASHESCKKYLRNISPEMDTLVKCALDNGAIGATGFGAGFGGSAYAVVRREERLSFIKAWRESYRAACSPPLEPEFFVCAPSPGACGMFDEQ